MTKKLTEYVLWLPAWFPSRRSSFNGDFIWRHAVATASYMPIVLLYLEKDPAIRTVCKEVHEQDNFTIIRIYYPVSSTNKYIESLASTFLYTWLAFREFRKIKKVWGLPTLIHVHIVQKSIIAGYLLSLWFKLPLILSEHSGHFLPESEKSYQRLTSWKKTLFSYILNKPKMITAVSNHLARNIQKISKREDIVILPNVVDETVFAKASSLTSTDSFKLIHISTFTPNKNIDAILQAVKLARQNHHINIELTLIGPVEMLPEIHRKDVPAWLTILPEMSQLALAKKINSHHALILYSTYETFGCVVAEAISCGRPVLVSNIPALSEYVMDGEQGFLVRLNDPVLLSVKINELREKYTDFSPAELHQSIVEKYGYGIVGKKTVDLYSSIKGKTNL